MLTIVGLSQTVLCIVFPFERVFRNEACDNRNLAELIKEKDMPYILYRAIRGLKRLRENEGKWRSCHRFL